MDYLKEVQLKRDLEKVEHKLRRMCHLPRCTEFCECPRHCCYKEINDPMLDLETSIAWEAAEEMYGYREYSDRYNKLLILFKVVANHEDSHKKLYSLISEAKSILYKLAFPSKSRW